MKELIYGELRPRMESLFWRTAREGADFVMEGVPVYNEKAQFVGGKAINMSCCVVLEFLKGTQDYEKGFEDLKKVIKLASRQPMETWGILNGITGLYRLKTAGLLEQAVDGETLEILKKALDWRTFVNEEDHYALINKPTNYYGVAFGIARYRELMEWEPEGHSHILLARLMEHIDQYSGELSYMDETPGDGRFDRYSILVPSEISSLLMATGMEVPEKIRRMLANSVKIFLQLADEKGLGFSYGRSIGAYGDTAALEVLSAAAEVGGIYSGEEQELAYGYSIKLMKTLMDFWYDSEMRSINMWEKGRHTDEYRNKNRILGENMSLFMQMMNSYEHWVRAGWGEKKISGRYPQLVEGIRKHFFVRFAAGEYDRALAVVRDQGHVWSLPLIGGGKGYYRTDPYQPVPQENLVLDQVADRIEGNLIPELVLEDGRILRPITFVRKIDTEEAGDEFKIVCRLEEMCLMGGMEPEKMQGIQALTTYRFTPGCIRRTDEFTVDREVKVREIRLAQIVYSTGASVSGEGNRVAFEQGVIRSLETEGYGECRITPAPADGSCDTPRGRLQTRVDWERKIPEGEKKISAEWTIRY